MTPFKPLVYSGNSESYLPILRWMLPPTRLGDSNRTIANNCLRPAGPGVALRYGRWLDEEVLVKSIAPGTLACNGR